MAAPDFTPMLLALPSLTPTLALEILPYGLTLHRLYVQADGKTHDILIGPEAPADHLTQKYTNTIIGRYANRVPAGTHSVSRNGLSSSLAVASNESPTVSLHGGLTGFDLRPWTPLSNVTDATLFTDDEKLTIQARLPSFCIYQRVAEDGEEGYPGRLLVEVLVGLVQPQGPPTNENKEWNLGSVVLVYRAKLLEEGKVTPINLTQHWGFNLAASLQEGQSVKEHTLNIKADHTLLLAADANSAGALAPVAGTHHAHAEKTTKTIGERFPEQGYDEFYLLAPRTTPTPPVRAPAADLASTTDWVRPALEDAEADVELASAQSGLRLSFHTNQSGVQFYSNNFSTPDKTARKKIHGGSGVKGDGYEPGSAAFLEFHEPLAAWLHPETVGRSGNDTLLASGEVYNNYVRLDVWYRSPEGL